MHFDDRLKTILANVGEDENARGTVWCQLADLLSQPQSTVGKEGRKEALDYLTNVREKVPVRRRLAASVSVAGRTIGTDLAVVLCRDQPQVAAPILARLQLTNTQWAEVLPQLPRASRALLRQRRDVDQYVRTALQSFGPSDIALPAAQEALGDTNVDQTKVQDGPTISDLVRRIEAWRSKSDLSSAGRAAKALTRFLFETNEAGEIIWVEGAPRTALIGLSIAHVTAANQPGVDGEAVGAFRKRDVIDGARLSLSGSAMLNGVWRLIARPFFHPSTGRFCGYRGYAKRGAPNAAPMLGQLELLGHEMQPDSVRQLVHELRTPLNAIRGFAEMIEGEFLGPVARGHRTQATQIVGESDRLLNIFEDLDIASQLASNRYVTGPEPTSDLVRLVKEAALGQTQLSASRGASLQVALPEMQIRLEQDQATIRRLIDRLMTVVMACASSEERIRMSVIPSASANRIVATKPKRLANATLRTLFDSVAVDSSGAIPELPLGVGFVFRLVDQLARRCGGELTVDDSEITLILPRESISAQENREPR